MSLGSGFLASSGVWNTIRTDIDILTLHIFLHIRIECLCKKYYLYALKELPVEFVVEPSVLPCRNTLVMVMHNDFASHRLYHLYNYKVLVERSALGIRRNINQIRVQLSYGFPYSIQQFGELNNLSQSEGSSLLSN